MPNAIESKLGFMNCNMSLTAEALTFLSQKTKGLTYYDIFLTILESMVYRTTTMKSGWGEVTLQPGQTAISNEELARQFKLNSKTMKGIVDRMAEYKLVSIHRSPTTTVIDVVCISGWYADGCYHRNPLYLHAKPSPTAPSVPSTPGTQNHA